MTASAQPAISRATGAVQEFDAQACVIGAGPAGLAAGKVRDGSTIVFVGAGLGFVWAATTIRWGPFAG